MAPTKIAVAPWALAKAGNESGDASVPTAFMVRGNALAIGVTVPRAVAPSTVKLWREMVCPEVKFAVAIVNVADCAPMPPLAKVKVEVPEVPNEGVEPNVKPEGKVTIKLDPMVIVEVEV